MHRVSNKRFIRHYTELLPIRATRRSHNTSTINKPCPEDAVGILEHAILQTDDDELGALESCLKKASNVLGMGEIERGVDLV
jgi:hypothetical protein